jgi:ABC-type nitrate/sulfonate/bicarbonate transport system ATPase subunit
LDIAWQDALYHELRELKKESDTTIVLVTHDISEAIELSDKIICLGMDGTIILKEENTKSRKLHNLIEETIIRDHQLRKLNEKKNYISVA